MVAPSRGRTVPPLQFTDEEKDLLLVLAQPIDLRQRTEFLQAVAAQLETSRQAGEIGEGAVHRVARTIQRKYWEPPQFGESKYRRA